MSSLPLPDWACVHVYTQGCTTRANVVRGVAGDSPSPLSYPPWECVLASSSRLGVRACVYPGLHNTGQCCKRCGGGQPLPSLLSPWESDFLHLYYSQNIALLHVWCGGIGFAVLSMLYVIYSIRFSTCSYILLCNRFLCMCTRGTWRFCV